MEKIERLKFMSTDNPDLAGLQIKAGRLLLRPIQPADAAEVYAEFNREITRYMFPKPAGSINEINDFISLSAVKLQALSDIILTIVDAHKGEFLGVCGLHSNRNHEAPELGIWIKKSAQGKKFGREAIGLLVDWVKNNIATTFLFYPVDKRNIASRKIPESLNGVIVSESMRQSLAGNTLQEVIYKINVETTVKTSN